MITYRRARVALTVAVGADQIGRVHIGHARTILAGSLIAQEHGCPFHIRLDGTRPDGLGQATADFLLSLKDLLHFLRIECRVYFHLQQHLPLETVASMTGLTGNRLEAYRLLGKIIAGHEEVRLSMIEDDAILYAPSLIIRGAEFINPGQWSPPDPAAAMATQMIYEASVFAALGVEKHEINVPLVLARWHKMSKSGVIAIGWEVLMMVPAEQARRYLIASLLNPWDTLAALDDDFGEFPFAPARIPMAHHEWNWETWAKFVKGG